MSGIPLPSNSALMIVRMSMVCFMPFALYFSYLPVFSLGTSESMNFELSIAEIYLVIFAMISILDRENFAMLRFAFGKKFWLFFLLPLFALLSAFWSTNPLRAVLTAGLIFITVFDALQAFFIIYNVPYMWVSIRRHFLRAAVIISVFCWLQCLLDVLGVPRGATGLCDGCTYQAFGFPHPNGFTIEPQFMGGMLIVPALLSLYSFIFEKDRPLFYKRRTHLFITLFLTTTLFLTFSRGAIYSFLVGCLAIFLLRFPVIKHKRKKSSKTNFHVSLDKRVLLGIPIVFGGFVIALSAQGLFAQISKTSDTFFSGISKSIHQLSLGKIDFRPEEISSAPETSAPKPSEPDPANTDVSKSDSAQETTSTFSGYVEQSTSFRTQLTTDALDIWNDSPTNLLFGTGLGSAGSKLLEKDPSLGTPKEIVQNQYASLLLELGLTGVILVLVILYATATAPLRFDPEATKTDPIKDPLRLGASVALLASLFFFAGLPNAFYVYLFPVFLASPLIEGPGGHK